MKTAILSLLLIFSFAIVPLQAQWVPTAGPYGGTVSSLTAVGTDLLAGTASGIFRSSDSGASWTNMTAGLGPLSVTGFAMLDSDVFAAVGSAILRSTDKGQSWRSIGTGLNNAYLSVLGAVGSDLFVTTGYSYLSTLSAVFRSTDRGITWSAVNGIPTDTLVYAFADIGNVFFAGTQVGLYRSTDSGASWLPAPNSGLLSHSMSALATVGDTIFAGTSSGVFFSTDFGNSWDEAAGYGYVSVNTLIANMGTLYAGTYSGLYWTTDGGTDWRQPFSGLQSASVLAIAPMGNLLFAGIENTGVSRSQDGGLRWNPVNTGLSVASILNAAVLGPRVFVNSSPGDLYYSEDSGTDWNAITPGAASSSGISALATNPANGALFAATYSGVMVSFDSGTTWSTAGSVSSAPSTLFVSGNDLFAGTSNGILRSRDNGTTWFDASSGLPAAELSVFAFAQSSGAGPGNALYCATIDDGVFYSSDSGVTWNDISPSLSASYDYSARLADMGADLFLGTQSNGLIISTDNGNSWNSGALDGQDVTALLVLGNDLFAATAGDFTGQGGGVYLSTDDGASWSDVSMGLPSGSPVTALAAEGPNLYAGTNALGVLAKAHGRNDCQFWRNAEPAYANARRKLSQSVLESNDDPDNARAGRARDRGDLQCNGQPDCQHRRSGFWAGNPRDPVEREWRCARRLSMPHYDARWPANVFAGPREIMRLVRRADSITRQIE